MHGGSNQLTVTRRERRGGAGGSDQLTVISRRLALRRRGRADHRAGRRDRRAHRDRRGSRRERRGGAAVMATGGDRQLMTPGRGTSPDLRVAPTTFACHRESCSP